MLWVQGPRFESIVEVLKSKTKLRGKNTSPADTAMLLHCASQSSRFDSRGILLAVATKHIFKDICGWHCFKDSKLHTEC